MGAIVQVVQATKTDAFQTAAVGWTLVPTLTATLTPSSVANQIVFMMKINLGSDGQNGVAYKVQRDGVDIDIGDALGIRTRATGASFGTSVDLDSGISLSEVYLDSPATINPVVYTVYVDKQSAANVNVNRSNNATDAANFFRTTSNIVLMEYAP